MFLPPRVRSTRPKSRHVQRSATLNALLLRLLQAKPFSLAATENRIGRGPRCRYGHCRRAVLLCRNAEKNRTQNLVAATATVGGPFLTAAARTLHRFASLALKSRIDAHRRA